MTEAERQTREAVERLMLPDVSAGTDPLAFGRTRVDEFQAATQQAVYSAIRCELRDELLRDDTGHPEDVGYNQGVNDALSAINRVEHGTAPTSQVPASQRGLGGFLADRLEDLRLHEGVADDGWADRWVADLLPLVSATTEHAARLEHSLKRTAEERDGAYRERAQLLAWLAAIHPSVITEAPDVDDDGWRLLFLWPEGTQLSWHIAPGDVDLFGHVETVDQDDPRAQWDGHTTEQKYLRIDGFTRRSGARSQTELDLEEARHTAHHNFRLSLDQAALLQTLRDLVKVIGADMRGDEAPSAEGVLQRFANTLGVHLSEPSDPADDTGEDRPTVIHRSAEQLRRQRAALVASTGMSEEKLRERAEDFALYPEHLSAWNTIEGIDYLLGEEG